MSRPLSYNTTPVKYMYYPIFSWKVDRDVCSAHCGHGTAKQYIACSLTTRYNTTLVDIKHCEKRITEIGPRPKDVVVCYGKCLETNWKYTDWTRVNITKTCLFKYLENFSSKNWKFSDKKLWYFSYFCSKHRLWVLVRTALARRF